MSRETYSRRELFRRFTRGLGRLVDDEADAGVDAPARAPAWLRPPGWSGDPEGACDGCTQCVRICPRGAIFKVPSGPEAGTPAINPAAAPCVLCLDLPCISECPENILRPVAREGVRMGLAEGIAGRCRHDRGEACTACHDACPLPGTAIRLEDGGEAGPKPAIVADGCTGCGTCVWACPESPKALRVVPAPEPGATPPPPRP